MGKCNITDKELAEALGITLQHLSSVCKAFDADPKDDWELTLGVHFEWGLYKSRVFSAEGAVEICNYLEGNRQERPLFQRWERWLLQRDRRLKGLMIAKRVEEVRGIEGQIIFKSGRAFLAPKACREILSLGTRQDVLWRAFREVQKAGSTDKEPLKVGENFLEDDSKRRQSGGETNLKYHYLSASGLSVVSKHLEVTLTQKHRKDWAMAVAEFAPPALEVIEKHELDKQKRIDKVKERIRRQAKGKCQLSGCIQSEDKFDMAIHHLFDQSTHPNLADMEINLIAIRDDIHDHFHKWMGGTHISCTVEDLERYIEEFGNSLFPDGNVRQATEARMQLSRARNVLRPMLAS